MRVTSANRGRALPVVLLVLLLLGSCGAAEGQPAADQPNKSECAKGYDADGNYEAAEGTGSTCKTAENAPPCSDMGKVEPLPCVQSKRHRQKHCESPRRGEVGGHLSTETADCFGDSVRVLQINDEDAEGKST